MRTIHEDEKAPSLNTEQDPTTSSEINCVFLFLLITSLALETIPSHRDYRTSLKSNKEYLRMVMCLVN